MGFGFRGFAGGGGGEGYAQPQVVGLALQGHPGRDPNQGNLSGDLRQVGYGPFCGHLLCLCLRDPRAAAGLWQA